MCKAFSCLVDKDKEVVWKLEIDSHSELINMSKYKDEDDSKKFIRIEITPGNDNYIYPDTWKLKIDSETRPLLFSPEHEQKCWNAHKKWLKQLNKIIIKKKIIHPFNDIKEVKKVTNVHIKLLKEWDSVRDSVRYSVWYSVWDSVSDSV